MCASTTGGSAMIIDAHRNVLRIRKYVVQRTPDGQLDSA